MTESKQAIWYEDSRFPIAIRGRKRSLRYKHLTAIVESDEHGTYPVIRDCSYLCHWCALEKGRFLTEETLDAAEDGTHIIDASFTAYLKTGGFWVTYGSERIFSSSDIETPAQSQIVTFPVKCEGSGEERWL